MSTYPVQPTFPVDVSADPGSGIIVSRQGTSTKLRLDPGSIGTGGTGVASAIAATTCGLHRALRLTPDGAGHYSASDAAQFGAYVGVSLVSGGPGSTIAFQASGPVEDMSWTWTPNQPVYASDDGTLTQSEPSVGVSQAIGRAVSATRVFLGQTPPVLL